MPEVVEVSKGGITWAEFSIDRSFKGLTIWARTNRQLELFMKGLGDGRAIDVTEFDKQWTLTKPGDPKLTVYHIGTIIPEDTFSGWTLQYPGSGVKMVLDRETVNLSFLRCVGISGPDGVRFTINVPHSRSYVKSLSGDILKGIRELIYEYVAPFTVNLRVSSQES